MSEKTQGSHPGIERPQAALKSTRVMVLHLMQAAGQSKVFRLNKERIVLGSVVSADVRLTGDGVAPIHAVIELSEGGSGTVYDLASDTGVFVNGVKGVTQPVKQGDSLKIGTHTLKFSVETLQSSGSKGSLRSGEGRELYVNPQEDTSALLLVTEDGVEEIFDYRPTSKPALEAVMSWCGTILDVEHFVKEKEVTVGQSRKSDFGIPPLLAEKNYAIITRKGGDFVLNLDVKMSGVVQRQGSLSTLDELRAQGGSSQIVIGQNDFAKVTIGEIDFYLSYTSAPPRLKRRRLFDRDALFTQLLFSSVLLSLLLIAGLQRIKVVPSLEAEQVPERIATVLYQPEKYVQKKKIEVAKAEPQANPAPEKKVEPPKPKPTPKTTTKLDLQPKNNPTPKPIPKEMDVGPKETKVAKSSGASNAAQGSRAENEAKEGEGARAKGEEGKRGSKTAAPGKDPQTAAKRPSPQGGQGTGGGNSQILDEGNVDLLKGASSKIQNLLGNSAQALGKGGEKLQGFGGFNTQGNGGLALSGSGRGGGGDAASLGGLSDKGRGGGRVGTGMGAAGNGSGIVGGRARVAINSGGPEEAVVMGAIDADAVEAALLAHKDEFRLCYEREINAENPNLAGRVGTTFVIGGSGRVNQAGIESTSLKNANAERCIINVIKRIQFPIPRGGGIVQVSYPFKFSSVGGR